jgi:hypothetical protein
MSLSASVPAIADMTVNLAGRHELQGLGSIRVEVTGMAVALGTSSVSEISLRAAVLARLKQRGVPVAAALSVDSPQLIITLGPVEYESLYFVTIEARLVERCSLARAPKPPERTCVTWRVTSPLAIVARGTESRLEQLVLAAVDQFANDYLFDNPKVSKNEETSNQGVQPTRGAPANSP